MQSSRIFSHLPDRYLQMARVNRGRLIIHERDERLHFLYVQTFLWVGAGRGKGNRIRGRTANGDEPVPIMRSSESLSFRPTGASSM